jgi:hypothetical protein
VTGDTGVADVAADPTRARGKARLWWYLCALVLVLSLAGFWLLHGSRHERTPQRPPQTEPSGTTLFGPSLEQPADLAKWRTAKATAPPVVRVFFGGTFPARWRDSPLLSAVPATTAVVLSFKTGTAAALTAFLESRPAGQKVYVSYWHEPEDDIAKGRFTAAEYRHAWQAYGPAIRAAGCTPTLILMQYTTSAGSGRDWHDYYPGAAVDVIAWDGYNPARKNRPPGYTDYETKVIPRFEAIAAETGKRWGMAEFGSPIVGTDARRVAWVKRVHRSLVKHRALWACWWDMDNPGFDNRASSAVVTAWRVP